MVLLFDTPGVGELLLILLLIIFLFGGKKIPSLMRNLGAGITEFKNARKKKETTGNDRKDS
jgi:sec-independent protein translocase protein TatA